MTPKYETKSDKWDKQSRQQNHKQEQSRSATWTTDISKAPLLDNIFTETGNEIAIFNCVLEKGG